MAKRAFRTPAQKVDVKKRTFENQRVRYMKLIEKFPNSPQKTIWEKLVASFSNQNK